MRAKIKQAAQGMMANPVLAHMREVAYETPINYSKGDSKNEEVIKKAQEKRERKNQKRIKQFNLNKD